MVEPIITATQVGLGSPAEPLDMPWHRSLPTELTQVTDGSACRWRTSLRLLWDPEALWVRFDCDDPLIWYTLTDRDADLFDEEVVEAFLCPTGDVRHYVEFELNPANAVFDAEVHSPDLDRATMTVDRDYTCEGLQTWVFTESPVHAESPQETPLAQGEGDWTAIIRFPFTAFGDAAPPPGTAWRANFFRIERPGADEETEYQAWSPTLTPVANYHVPGRFGTILFG